MYLESLNLQDQLHVGKGKKKFKAVLSDNIHTGLLVFVYM